MDKFSEPRRLTPRQIAVYRDRDRVAISDSDYELIPVHTGDLRALLAELEAKDKRIAELEDIEQSLCAANVTLDARASEAEAKLATPVRLPETYSPDPWMGLDPSGTWLEKEDVKESIRAAGFTVEGDE